MPNGFPSPSEIEKQIKAGKVIEEKKLTHSLFALDDTKQLLNMDGEVLTKQLANMISAYQAMSAKKMKEICENTKEIIEKLDKSMESVRKLLGYYPKQKNDMYLIKAFTAESIETINDQAVVLNYSGKQYMIISRAAALNQYFYIELENPDGQFVYQRRYTFVHVKE